MTILSPFLSVFTYSLQPIAPFTWFGLGVTTLDVFAAFRLCLVLRQIKEYLHFQHVKTHGSDAVEDRSFIRSLATTLTVVYGGEAVTGPFLGIAPSFMLSGTYPALYAVAQAIVDHLPTVPTPSLQLELPLAIADGFTRAFLLCNLIPPSVVTNASPLISSSPWTLLLTSLITANAGFFFTNLFSFLNPTQLSLQTPPELKPYGWTTIDLWCAPVTTGVYAMLTHAQPFWADLHTVVVNVLGNTTGGKAAEAVDPETARVFCALVLSTLFAGRAVRMFGGWSQVFPPVKEAKEISVHKGKTKTQ